VALSCRKRSEAFVTSRMLPIPRSRQDLRRNHLVSRAAANQRFVIAATSLTRMSIALLLLPHHAERSLPNCPQGDRSSGPPSTDDVSNWYLDQRRTDLLPCITEVPMIRQSERSS
jgi:hypothetical protein